MEMELNFVDINKTARLEEERGWWNSTSSGKMRRYVDEHRYGEGDQLFLKYPDALARRYKEQNGLDTRVVCTVNDEY